MPNTADPFLSKGIFLWQVPNILHGDPAGIATALQDACFQSVYIKATDGKFLFPTTSHPQLSLALVQALHDARIAVVGWGFMYGSDPLGEADAAIAACNQFGLDGFIWDVEGDYDSQPQAVAKAGSTVRRFKAGVAQHTPTAFCGWPHYWDPATGGEWHPATVARAFMEECEYGMPMMYWQSFQDPTTFCGTSLAEWQQITTKPIIPVGRAYDGDNGKAKAADMTAFEAAVRAKGCQGISWWFLENAYKKPALWAALTAMQEFGPSTIVTIAAPASDQVSIVFPDGKVCTGKPGADICSGLIRGTLVGEDPPAVAAGIGVHLPADGKLALVFPNGKITVDTEAQIISLLIRYMAGELPQPPASTIAAAIQRLASTPDPLLREGEVELDHVGHDLVKFHVLTFDAAEYELVVDSSLCVEFPHVWMQSNGCEYATNGGAGWKSKVGAGGKTTTKIYGLSAYCGQTVGAFDNNWQQVYADANGVFSLNSPAQLYTTFPFTNMLVKNSTVQPINKAVDFRARTAIGQTADGKTVIVTVDGGDYDKNHGMSFQEVAELMARLGCSLAVMLDGGNSTCMAHQEAGNAVSIIGIPSGEEHVVLNGVEYDIRLTAGHMGIRKRA